MKGKISSCPLLASSGSSVIETPTHLFYTLIELLVDRLA